MEDKDSLDLYLREARERALVPRDETALLAASREGNQEAKKKLVESYLSLAAEIGLRLAQPGMTRIEAVQEANLVLLRLVDKGVDQPAVELTAAIAKHFEDWMKPK